MPGRLIPTANDPDAQSDVESAVNGVAHIKAKSKNQLRRLKNKAKKQAGAEDVARGVSTAPSEDPSLDQDPIDLVPKIESDTDQSSDLSSFNVDDPGLEAFAEIFKKFQGDGLTGADEEEIDAGPAKPEMIYSDEDEDDEDDRERAIANHEKMSKKKMKKLAKLSVAELKSLVAKPEVVDWYDCDARDPRLLVSLKSQRNTVPVPMHWSAKREYLQGKRGIEKAAFQLPAWIADTGIADQRDAIKEKEVSMTLKQKSRERVQPKMGKIDIDYQKLHDAFFKYQSKPQMSRFGDAYYEGKELETDLRTMKPGDISEELKEALSIPPLAPPPWLIAMQRFGPPPSYPNMRIRGLNAPIPEGAQWGFHPGGWGRPPVDEFQRPLYGDPFGVLANQDEQGAAQIDRELWGTLEPEVEDSEEEDEEEDEEDLLAESQPHGDGLETPSGKETPSGTQSVLSTVPGGLETPDFLQLRKDPRAESDVSSTPVPRDLYQVVPERQTATRGFFGSSTAYDVSAIAAGSGAQGPRVLGAESRGVKRKGDGVAMSIDPENLANLSQEELQARYAESRSTSNRVHVPGADVDRDQLGEVMATEQAKRSRPTDRDSKKRTERKEDKFKF